MTCEECVIAQTQPYHCVYRAGCMSCVIRAVSDQPSQLREQFLNGIADDAKREETRAAIGAEWRRRKALIAETA